jgi:transcriptional regulator of acetoin/glycerol metabolism
MSRDDLVASRVKWLREARKRYDEARKRYDAAQAAEDALMAEVAALQTKQVYAATARSNAMFEYGACKEALVQAVSGKRMEAYGPGIQMPCAAIPGSEWKPSWVKP